MNKWIVRLQQLRANNWSIKNANKWLRKSNNTVRVTRNLRKLNLV